MQKLIIIILIIGAIYFSSSITYETKDYVSVITNPQKGIPVKEPPGKAKKTLQLNTINFTSPSPPSSGGSCNHDNGKPAQEGCACKQVLLECKNNKCERIISVGPYYHKQYIQCEPVHDIWCSNRALTNGDGNYCLGKPVIYLYPETPTYVDVSVTTHGEIVISDPLYPDGGWKNVLAYPDGTLIYQNKKFTELFYESEIDEIQKPETGITLSSKNLKSELERTLTQLGLNTFERNEFIEFWLPRLNALNSPYIYFSLIESEEKERIDHIDILPPPDTFIEVLVYFTPIDQPLPKTLKLPTAPPQRIGFTAVEWGGTINYKL